MKQKDPFIIRHACGIGICLFIAIMLTAGGILLINTYGNRRQQLEGKETFDMNSLSDNGSADTGTSIYEGLKSNEAYTSIYKLSKDGNDSIPVTVKEMAQKYERAFNERDMDALNTMLSPGVTFHWDLYFSAIESKVPGAVMDGAQFGKDGECYTVGATVYNRKKGAFGEVSYDYKNSFYVTFCIYPDTESIMPYDSSRNFGTDPYVVFGMDQESDGKY